MLEKICAMLADALNLPLEKVTPDAKIVEDGDTLDLGKHKLVFIPAPMVHWPEVMVSLDVTSGTLFSADAFGMFGALNGAMFADEVDFDRDHLDEARRYYSNIVGKYGKQVQSLLEKVIPLEVKRVCPLHGFVWRRNIDYYVNKYMQWSRYEPEKRGVVIAYASVYGNTENVANILACHLREAGVECVMHDVSVSEHSHIIADMFKYSHIVFASVTYNGKSFVNMENLLHDIVAHNIKGRKISFIENGSWAGGAARSMRGILSPLKDTELIGEPLNFKSSLHSGKCGELDALRDAILKSVCVS